MKVMNKMKHIFNVVALLGIVLSIAFTIKDDGKGNYLSPSDFSVDDNGKYLYVTQQTQQRIDVVDIKRGKTVRSLDLTLPPKTIVENGKNLLVVTSHSEGELLIVDKKKLEITSTIKVGNGAADVVVSPQRDYAYTANQFSDDVSFVNLSTGEEEARVKVLRQPMVLEISKDGRYLFVANFITDGRADADTVTSKVSVIDIHKKEKIYDIPLANGSNALRGICLSDDGKYVFVSHNLGRFQVPTSQLEQGWMNTSAMSVIDAEKLEYVATILLDEIDRGAAGSWGIDCSDKHIAIAHSGTHDFSLIDYPAFVDKLNNHPEKSTLDYDLRFLTDLRVRISVEGNGPRALAFNDNRIFVANYFSDNINVIDIDEKDDMSVIAMNSDLRIDSVRLGEMYFHDASFCFQEWQSCTGCHPNDARTDGLNWDLLNDGIGNPKNCKSMVMSHVTPPAMITGIRPSAEIAVRAGFKYIQFTEVDEDKTRAVDAYLKSLKPVPSPYLVDGKLSEKAEKGKVVFEQQNCTMCHPSPLYTNMQQYEMGVQGQFDHQNIWDTPTLVETWRTPPYLHDGRSATMKEVFSVEKHGINGEISDEEIEYLVEFVLSL